MKKVTIIATALLALSSTTSFVIKSHNPELGTKQIIQYDYKTTEGINEKLCNDVLISFLSPYTQKAVNNFYNQYLKELPGADPNFDTVLSVERISGENHLNFLIKVETTPYIGAHNSVGIDHITFRLNVLGEVKFENFEHIESSNILQQLYPDIIKKWPPS